MYIAFSDIDYDTKDTIYVFTNIQTPYHAIIVDVPQKSSSIGATWPIDINEEGFGAMWWWTDGLDMIAQSGFVDSWVDFV